MIQTADVAIIGAGSGGLATAYAAANLGARTILIEKGKMGGDCLNYGCVPSKALLAAAHRVAAPDTNFGLANKAAQVRFAAVNRHIHQVIATIAPNDSVKRYRSFGVKVMQGSARFISPTALQVNRTEVRAKYYVIATGSSPTVPPIPGLAETPYFTNETIFNNKRCPERLLILGGGPIGIEMAQAHAQLGAQVTVLDMASILPRDDQDLVGILRRRLARDGIELQERISIQSVSRHGKKIRIYLKKATGSRRTLTGSHLLVAAGRRANIADLDLDKAGIKHSSHIEVNERLQTSNRRVYGVGDVVTPYQFTHIAAYHAGIVIRNILFRLPARVDYRAVPWVTYTRPELAHCGLSWEEATRRYAATQLETLRFPFAANDRAQAERMTEGLAKATVTKKGKILGVDIIGDHAGELIQPWCLAMQNKLKIGALASYIAPYPTLGEVNKRLAGSYYAPRLFDNPRVKTFVRFLLRCAPR